MNPSRSRRSLPHAFRDAGRGVLFAARTQRNLRIHLFIAVTVGAFGLIFGLQPTEWALLALTIGAVISTEILNTAVEALADATCPDFHPLIRVAKDAAAGAVLVSAIAAVCVGLFVFGPHLLALVH